MDAPAKTKRRRRWERHPTGKRVTPGAYETVWFQKLWQHGPLTTDYLFEFTKDIKPFKNTVKGRLKSLYHENNTPHGSEYLDRPVDQNRQAKHFVEIHENDTAAEELLKERGLIPHTSPPCKKTNFLHRFMASSISASIELTGRQKGISFVPEHELLAKAPSGSLKIPVTFSYKGRSYDIPIIPDGYFGLRYPDGGGVRAFLFEADRSTERVHTDNMETQRSYLRKILQYQALMTRPTRTAPAPYHKHLGLNPEVGVLVLNVTTSYRHMESIIAEVMQQTGGRGSAFMLFKVLPQFADKYAVPPVLSELLTTPWRRAGYPEIDISKP